MMDRDRYCDTLRDDAAALLAAVHSRPNEPAPRVPCCPGWTVTDLVLHLGAVHRHAAKIVANGEREQVPISPDNLGWLGLPHPYLHWVMTEKSPTDQPVPPAVLAWFEEGAERVERVIYGADPDEPAWSWSPDKRVAHYQRMLAIETAVHRHDAQEAYGQPGPIDAAFARDGIDHTFDVMLPARREWTTPRPGAGESYHFHQTDGDGEWTVRFEGDGATVARGHQDADVTLAGTASDLFLYLWGRLPARELAVSGDAALLDRYAELVPPR